MHKVENTVILNNTYLYTTYNLLVITGIPYRKLTTCSRVIIEKLTVTQLVKKFFALYGIKWTIRHTVLSHCSYSDSDETGSNAHTLYPRYILILYFLWTPRGSNCFEKIRFSNYAFYAILMSPMWTTYLPIASSLILAILITNILIIQFLKPPFLHRSSSKYSHLHSLLRYYILYVLPSV
jgi:hypothetical protein